MKIRKKLPGDFRSWGCPEKANIDWQLFIQNIAALIAKIFTRYLRTPSSPGGVSKLLSNFETGYDYLFKNNRLLFSITIDYCFPYCF